MIKCPIREEATAMMLETQRLNPGPWVEHSINVGKAARSIAQFHSAIDAETAFILGYLHDIGRREGVTDMRHTIDGYDYLKKQGYDDAARICMTHSFPVPSANYAAGEWDCTDEEFEFALEYIAGIEYTIYDRLIQLCDAPATASGYCLLESNCSALSK